MTIMDGLRTDAYNKTVQLYYENAYIPVAKNCFAYMFTNVGDTTADIDGMVVFPATNPATTLGDSRSISGHKLDVYTGTLNLRFHLPLGANPAIEVVQLFYI